MVGIIVNLLDPGSQKSGLIGAAILGVVGAIVGGMMATLLTGTILAMGSSLLPLLVALVGSVALVFISKALKDT